MAVALWSSPSAETVWVIVAATTPERASLQLQVSTTSPAFHPFGFAGVRPVKVISGSVRSISTSVWVSEDWLPARSVQVPVASWSAPSFARVWVTLASSGPDRSSVQSQVSSTAASFQPGGVGRGVLARRS